MGLPTTLIGTIGMMILIVFLVGQVDSSMNQDSKINELQKNVYDGVNQSSQPSSLPILGDALNTLDIVWNSLKTMLAYLSTFLGVSGSLPSEFYVFFAIVGIAFVVAIVKLARGVWDR